MSVRLYVRPYFRTYICLSSHPWAVCDFCICIHFQCGGQALRFIYPHTGVQRTPVGSIQDYMHFSLYFCLSVSISGFRIVFWKSKCAAYNCTQCMRPQATGSNSRSGSIICLSVCPSVHMSVQLNVCLYSRLRDFCNFCISIDLQSGGLAPLCIYSIQMYQLLQRSSGVVRNNYLKIWTHVMKLSRLPYKIYRTDAIHTRTSHNRCTSRNTFNTSYIGWSN